MQRKGKVEALARMDLFRPDQIDHLRQKTADWCGTAVKVNVSEEQLLSLEFYVVRNADIAYVAAGPRGADRLHHRLLSADALQYRIRADTLRQILDAGHAFITALRHDFRSTKLHSNLLSLLVTAHGDDPFPPHALSADPNHQTYPTLPNHT